MNVLLFRSLLLFVLMAPHDAARATDRFIFYWGDQQCELLASGQFKGKLKVTPVQFRRMIYQRPSLWNGAQIIKDFTFKIDDKPIVADAASAEYSKNFAWLEADYGEKVEQGALVRLSDIALEEGVIGGIDITVAPQEEKEESGQEYWVNRRVRELRSLPAQEQNIDAIRWGKDARSDLGSRNQHQHFYTAAQFVEAVKELPEIEYKLGVESAPLSMSLGFYRQSAQVKAAFTLALNAVNAATYRSAVENHLNTYKHLIKPGIVIELKLSHSETHSDYFLHEFEIVSDGDPRLVLRSPRDLRTVRAAWHKREETFPPLFLRAFPVSDSVVLHADLPFQSTIQAMGLQELEAYLFSRPFFWVDDIPVEDLSYDIEWDGRVYSVNAAETIPEALREALRAVPSSRRRNNSVFVKNFRSEAYDLHAVQYHFFLTSPEFPFFKNNNQYQNGKVNNNIKLRLAPADSTAAEWTLEVDMPQENRGVLYMFPSGSMSWPEYIDDDVRPKGKILIKVPKSALRSRGMYFIVLDTPDGFVSKEIQL